MISIDSFPKIDAHVHLNANRTHLLKMAANYNFSLLTINTEVPEFPSIQKQQKLAKEHQQSSETALFYATTVSTDNVFRDDWAEQAIAKIKQDLSAGACGVKFWKNIGMSIQRADGTFLMLDDAEFKQVFEFLEKQQIPVLGHQGEPKSCWLPVEEMNVKSDREYFSGHPEYHMYLHSECPDYWEHIEARDQILARHPNLQFVGLHLASLEWSLDEITKRLQTYPNLAVDLAERISHLYHHAAENQQKVIDFFEKFQNRIIYGTDIIDDPAQSEETIKEELDRRWSEHWNFFATDQQINSSQIKQSFRGLALPEHILEKVYYTNAQNKYQLV